MAKVRHNRDYAEERRRKYPDWRTLAEAIYEEAKGNPKPMQDYIAACDKVKADIPKAAKAK